MTIAFFRGCARYLFFVSFAFFNRHHREFAGQTGPHRRIKGSYMCVEEFLHEGENKTAGRERGLWEERRKTSGKSFFAAYTPSVYRSSFTLVRMQAPRVLIMAA